jgi:hypothetical protein
MMINHQMGYLLVSTFIDFTGIILNIVGITQDSWNNEPLQAQRSRRNKDLRDILRKSCIV